MSQNPTARLMSGADLARGSWLKPGAVVIDAGYNPGNVGDVDSEEANLVAGLLTPVPGGAGPMTIAVLLIAAESRRVSAEGDRTGSPGAR